jgi:hypothetical protein
MKERRNMKKILVATILTISGGALAQPAPQPRPARPAAGQPGTTTAPPRVRNYDFDADFIDGELVRPEGEFLSTRRTAEHGSLIKVRTDFIREIVKSAEDL